MNEKQFAYAQRMGMGINNAERRMDGALKSVAAIFQELDATRTEGEIGAEIGQPVVERLAAAMGALATARAHVVAAHKGMAVGAAMMDFEPFTGEGNKPPPPSGMTVVPIAA